MSWAAVAGAAVGVVGSVIGGEKQAAAAGKAGARAEQLAREQQDRALAEAQSPEQLASLEKQMASQEQNLAREEKFLSNIDPTLIEASQQALKLLRGEQSSAVDPVREQRKRQRQQLVDQLREQLGPGAETSSAGMQALQNFDFQTSQSISGAQQSSLQMLLGSTQQSGQTGRSGLSSLGQMGLGISGQFGSAAQRRVNAVTGTTGGVAGAAGGQFAGDAIRGGAISAIGGNLLEGGIAGIIGQSGGTKKPTGTGSGTQAGGSFDLGSNIA